MRLRAAVTVLVLAASACSHKPNGPAPVPTTEEVTAPPTSATPTSVTVPPGRPRTSTTTEPPQVQGGAARIAGTVVSPQGVVTGATVRVERFVEDQVATVNVGAGSGQFNLIGVQGGRYRVQAWRTPDLLLLEPEVFFLAADENKTLELPLAKVADVNVRATTSPDPPPPDDQFAINVFLYAATVSDQGVLQATPRPNEALQAIAGPGLALAGPDRTVTDGGGGASFRARCLASGPMTVDVLVSTFRFNLALPACRR